MKITFLGTGTSQGVPVIACDCSVCKSSNFKDNRLRSSVFIEFENEKFVIDTGPDFRQQMLRAKVKKLDAVLLTHSHKDHVGGMDDVRAFNYFMQKPIDVYGSNQVLNHIKNEFSYAFAEERYPGVPEINLHTIENKEFTINGVKIIPILSMHYQLPIFGFRIGDFTYITDANFISEIEKAKIIGSKILVINALRKKQHISHFTLDEALEIIAEVKPEKAYLTHISHQMGLHNEEEKNLPVNVFFAYDGLEIGL
ncbi:MAG: MBL fold metallo-hydrolase [Bacteroidetes bacterium]|nr:MBL fold metallo-hydrolase [Bacteroidota bacterium]